jgi:hypothetical protein
MKLSVPLRDRLKASGIHLLLSCVIAALCALLVFGIWYPYPYREISGGRELFLIVIFVDIIMGPLITFTVFNRNKPFNELRRDLTIVVLLQIAALAYGLWTVCVARPVHMVFEIDRFRVVHAIEIPLDMLDKTPSGVDALPFTGPTLLAVRPFHDANEGMEATMAALKGAHLSVRPDLWQPYAQATPRVLQAAHPLALLKTRFPDKVVEMDQLIAAAGGNVQTALYLPLVGRKSFWTVFLDPAANVLGALPLDSF